MKKNKIKAAIVGVEPTDVREEIAPTEDLGHFVNADPYALAERLMAYDKTLMDTAKPVLRENGLVNTVNGHIMGVGHSVFGNFIPCVPVNEAMPNATMICNTVNNGFRFCGLSEDGKTVDLGPVTEVCIVGNATSPYGFYVPVNNPRALYEGYMIMKDLYDARMKELSDESTPADKLIKEHAVGEDKDIAHWII